MKYFVAPLTIVFVLFSNSALASDRGNIGETHHEKHRIPKSASIAETHRLSIQGAMQRYIMDVTEKNRNGKFPIYDESERTVIQLKLDHLHNSVEVHGRKNPYFISCAYFKDEKGIVYDIDFLVSGTYEVVATLIHSKDGKKTPYDIH